MNYVALDQIIRQQEDIKALREQLADSFEERDRLMDRIKELTRKLDYQTRLSTEYEKGLSICEAWTARLLRDQDQFKGRSDTQELLRGGPPLYPQEQDGVSIVITKEQL